MSQEILAVLDHIERERGIKKEVLVAAVESALVSAARKVIKVGQDDEIKVNLDGESGEIKVFLNDKEVNSVDFGRIAAQTAKQVIIQKIREAEKEVIFSDFSSKVGDIVSGAVYRFDKGNIVVDLLGKAEGFIPHRERCVREQFKQGDRIKAYVLEVNRRPRGPQIVLSRAHPNMVKKLFELEVPEIYDGVVEIKSIARDPGERTKIAVYSKDEKIDCMGACVGMRGSRVKNVVNELQDEKIDIVRWSSDAKDYIASALGPAKISQMDIDKEKHRALVIVADDQLSLAIGKRGQNVRLASQLTGYTLDIRTKEMLQQEAEEAQKAQEAEQAPSPSAGAEGKEEAAASAPLSELKGVGPKTAEILRRSGFEDVASLAGVSAEQLSAIKGIGAKTAAKIIGQLS
ncbi:MAG: transcription termination factor NusA [Candidatus Omnitrophota bacterium]